MPLLCRAPGSFAGSFPWIALSAVRSPPPGGPVVSVDGFGVAGPLQPRCRQARPVPYWIRSCAAWVRGELLLEPAVQVPKSMSASPPQPQPGTSGGRRALGLAAGYAGALVCAALLFLAWRLHVHHASYAARDFFWLGDLHVPDDRAGFKLRPHGRGEAVLRGGIADPHRRIPVRTDQLGFRVPLDRDSTDVRPGGLAAIGCSCTFGHGVAAESSYVYQAGVLLGLPAYNLGVCGYSAITSLVLLEEKIALLQPRFVVYGFGNFHLERSARPTADGALLQPWAVCDGQGCRIEPPCASNAESFALQPRLEALYYQPKLEGQPRRFDLQTFRVLLPLVVQDLQRATEPRFRPLHASPHVLPDTVFCRFLVDRLLETCRSRGAQLVILWFPASFRERPLPGMLAAVEAHHGERDLTFVDSSPGLPAGMTDETAYRARWQVPRDGHPNRFMHLEMARALAAALGSEVGAASASGHH